MFVFGNKLGKKFKPFYFVIRVENKEELLTLVGKMNTSNCSAKE